jgi:hypothetical protein
VISKLLVNPDKCSRFHLTTAKEGFCFSCTGCRRKVRRASVKLIEVWISCVLIRIVKSATERYESETEEDFLSPEESVESSESIDFSMLSPVESEESVKSIDSIQV